MYIFVVLYKFLNCNALQSRHPSVTWVVTKIECTKRTNNGPESFNMHFNEQCYSQHIKIYIYLDVINRVKTTTFIKVKTTEHANFLTKA